MTERMEIRVYRGKETPELVLTKKFTPEQGDEAEAFFRKFDTVLNPYFGSKNPHKEVDGVVFDGVEFVLDPDGDNEEITSYGGMCPFEVEATANDSGSWKREMAMEAGMLHGIQGYNDVMGH